MTLGAACGLAGEKSMNRSGSWATWGSAVLLLALSSSAAAKATLNARFTNATCDLNTGLAVMSVACSPLPEIGNAIGFDAVIPRGGSASVTATLVYTYTDDGLPVEDYDVFYLDANAFTWETTYFEAGALYVTSNSCEGSRYCEHDPTLFIVGSTGFPPILLGLNTVADRVTGSINLFSAVVVTPPYQFDSLTTPVYVGWNAVTYSGVVPEPSTFVLTAAGLALLLGSRAVRRRAGSASCSRGEMAM
jgi:hypothetical protein